MRRIFAAIFICYAVNRHGAAVALPSTGFTDSAAIPGRLF